MSTIRIKGNLLIAACLLLAVSLPAQQTATIVYDNNNTEHIETSKNGKRYKLEFTEDKLTLLIIDGVTIPKEKWGEYNALVTELQEQLKRDRAQAEKDREQAAKDREQAKLDRIQADRHREQAAKEREQVKLDRIQAEKDRAQAVKDREQADKDRLQASKDRVQAEKDREQAKLDRIQAEKDRARAAEDRKLLEELTSDLVADKLIADSKDLHNVTLNKQEMIVNGVKQTEAVAAKYREKYSRFANGGMNYSVNGTRRQFSVTTVN